jgi:hypothetical protein
MNSDDKINYKSVIIDGNLHNKFKILCKGKSLKIGGLIEDLIQLYLQDPKKIQALIEESKEFNYAKHLNIMGKKNS